MPKNLTLKQLKFIDYYLNTGNASKSAKLAGYTGSYDYLRYRGHKNLNNKLIREAIKNRITKDNITPEYVLLGISKIADNTDKASDKLRAYELLGKYLKLFTDNEPDKPSTIILKLGGIDNDVKRIEADNIVTLESTNEADNS